MAELRNQADGLIHNCEKSLKDLAQELSEDEKKDIEKAISELKEAIQGTDKAQIEDKIKVLSEASGKMSERIYAKKSAETQSQHEAPKAQESSESADASVVDAEFEEVKEDKGGKE